MLGAVAVLNFVFSWHEFLFAFLLTSRDARTLPVMIPALAGTMDLDWPLMSAMSTVVMIPSFLFVALVQRYLVRGLVSGIQ
jgi:ABC-type glycerol-3-phosphate transport system permease component